MMPDYDVIKKASGRYELRERPTNASVIIGFIVFAFIIALLMFIAGPVWFPIQIASDFLRHSTPQTLVDGFMNGFFLLLVNIFYATIVNLVGTAYAIKAKGTRELKEYNRRNRTTNQIKRVPGQLARELKEYNRRNRSRVFIHWLLIFCALWLLELIPFTISIYLQSQPQPVLH